MDLPWERENRLKISLITGFSQVERTAEKRDGGRVLLTNQAWEHPLSHSQVVHLVPAAASRQRCDVQVLL